MNGKRILIADDEQDILDFISYNLVNEGYEVTTATNGEDAITLANKTEPDLIILDVMMPRKNGIQTCEILRSNNKFDDTIILFLTALSDDNIQIKGLEIGADDYISKPISPKVLVSKINALFRRRTKNIALSSINTNNNDFTIDEEKYIVYTGGEEIILARKEFELINLLFSKPGKVFLRNEILQKVWGNDVIVGDRTIDVHVRKIRVKLGVDCIKTIKGIGYKFDL